MHERLPSSSTPGTTGTPKTACERYMHPQDDRPAQPCPQLAINNPLAAAEYTGPSPATPQQALVWNAG